MEEHPDAAITVVVDATFGHRIDKREVAEFEAGISNNELVAPPAGAIGRGDAFVLSIAQKANASILSNDSFQEFHADYEWLFDEGRLIGGKPVPHVGWVFVNRSPVRGPVSRKATQGARGRARAADRSAPTPTAASGAPEQREPARQRADAGSEVATTGSLEERRSSAAAVEAPHGEPAAGTACRRRRQRAHAVPRVRRAPSDRHERQRHRRDVFLARCVHQHRHGRRSRLHPIAPDVRSAADECRAR